ncbi:MAG: helix-turn-helix transcriptional regulator [Anaerolineae bacterium]|nr:helix-turn-helix transcriptional regulator [Anaerolineae bacterium]
MDNDFVTWLIEELEQRGWTNSELARRAGVSPSTVSVILSRQKNPGPDFCLAIAGALRQPPEQVFRLAGILPSLPPAVEEEHEAIAILRGLPPNLRTTGMAVLRTFAGNKPDSRSLVREDGAGIVEHGSSKDREDRLLWLYHLLPDELQEHAVEEMERLVDVTRILTSKVKKELKEEPK